MAADEPLDLDPVRMAADEATAQAAYDTLLDTVGHNHSGTLFAHAESAVEPLLTIALSEPGWPANTALDALTEIIGSFQSATRAEPGRPFPDVGMKQRMRAAVTRRREELSRLSNGSDQFGSAQRARELLAELDRPAR